ncbi:hypothetical protein HJG60_010418 [Phyllostomus discolor]|uniref:Uncharacterized protein n=1 Tax=Phyllostomus discolor TaxID=89673 RepID=A0A834AYG9_9CHIR|nr:hypothetical protein HJG60_010418 [Phyllostomus discolor]
MLVMASQVHTPSGTPRQDTELRKLLCSAGSSAGAGTAPLCPRRPGSGLRPGHTNRVRQQRVSVSCPLNHGTGLTAHLGEPGAAGSTRPQVDWVLAAWLLPRGPHPTPQVPLLSSGTPSTARHHPLFTTGTELQLPGPPANYSGHPRPPSPPHHAPGTGAAAAVKTSLTSFGF